MSFVSRGLTLAYGGLLGALLAGCGDGEVECVRGGLVLCPSMDLRLLRPVSGARIAQGPLTFYWSNGEARVEVCADRACTRIVRTSDAGEASVRLESGLGPGLYFWRVRPVERVVDRPQTWPFRVDARRVHEGGLLPPSDDLDGDGLADVVTTTARGTQGLVFLGARSGISSAPSVSLMNPHWGGELARPRRGGDISGAGQQAIKVFGASSTEFFWEWSSRHFIPSSVSLPTARVIADLDADGLVDFLDPVSGDLGLRVRYGRPVPPYYNVPERVQVVLDAGRTVMADAGDVNGDGFTDVLVGLPASRDGRASPSARVYFGSATGLTAFRSLPLPVFHEGYGGSVSPAGDVNGDGCADLLVRTGRAGAAVYLGGAVLALHRELRLPSGDDLVVSRAGDVNGDGYHDLLAVPVSRAQAWLYLGSAAGLAEVPEVLRDAAWSDCEGTIAAPGDLDGDGHDDLYYGAPSVSEVRVFYGSASDPLTRTQVLAGERGSELGLDVLW